MAYITTTANTLTDCSTITVSGNTTDSFTAGTLVQATGETFTDCTSFTTTTASGTTVYFKTRTNPETGLQEMVPQL